MQTLFDGAEGVSPLNGALRWGQTLLIGNTEGNPRFQGPRIPSHYERWQQCLIEPGGNAQEINDWDPVLIRLTKPSIISRIRILTHECVVNRFVAGIDLTVNFSLVVLPDLAAGFWENGPDR